MPWAQQPALNVGEDHHWVNRRNGYHARGWNTRVGTIDLAVPKLRTGSYFPGCLLEPRFVETTIT